MNSNNMSEERRRKMIEDTMAAEKMAIDGIPIDNPYLECVRLILDSKRKGGKIVFVGLGQSMWLGRKIAANFNTIGMPALAMAMSEAAVGALNVLSKNDTLVILSQFGMDAEAHDAYELARRLQPTVPSIAITSKTDSPLSLKCDFVLSTGDPEEADPLGLLSSTSNTTMAVIGDILGVMIVRFSNFGAADYSLRQRHTLHEDKAATDAKLEGKSLTEKEMRVLEQLAYGLKSKEIAKVMGITHHGVTWTLRAIYEKLGVNNRVLAVSVAKANGILGADAGKS